MHHLIKEIKREQDINSALQHLKRKKVSQEQRLIHDFFSISSVIVKQFRELFVTRENSQYFYKERNVGESEPSSFLIKNGYFGT